MNYVVGRSASGLLTFALCGLLVCAIIFANSFAQNIQRGAKRSHDRRFGHAVLRGYIRDAHAEPETFIQPHKLPLREPAAQILQPFGVLTAFEGGEKLRLAALCCRVSMRRKRVLVVIVSPVTPLRCVVILIRPLFPLLELGVRCEVLAGKAYDLTRRAGKNNGLAVALVNRVVTSFVVHSFPSLALEFR